MHKKKLNLIIGILTTSILGIVILQMYWLSISIETQKKTFDQNVNHVLRLVADNIEKNEFIAVLNLVSNKSDIENALSRVKEEKDSLGNKEHVAFSYAFSSRTSKDENSKSDSSWVEVNSGAYVVGKQPGVAKRLQFLKKKETELQNLNNEIEEKIYVADQSKFNVNAFAFDSLEINAMFSTTSDNSNRFKYIRKRAIYDAIINPIIKKRDLDLNRVDSLLTYYLNEQGINTEYAFSIQEKNKLTGDVNMRLINRTNSKVDFNNALFTTNLFHDEFIAKDNILSVVFPSKSTYIWKNTIPALLLSLFFIAIVIYIFIMIIKSMLKQKKVSEMKNDFINNMTHELKTPISTIALASEGILKQINGSHPKVTQYADIIYDENRRLSKQVEKILQISQIERESLKLDITEFDLHGIIKDVVSNYHVRIEEKQTKIELNLKATDSLILADRVHINNVINNLIDNALKYSKNNPLIVINTQNEGSCLILKIKDNGIGIPKESLEYIFEKFYRVPKGDIHDVKGFGLGLTYVKNICDAHHIDVEVQSEIDIGTEFILTLDLAQTYENEELDHDVENINR